MSGEASDHDRAMLSAKLDAEDARPQDELTVDQRSFTRGSIAGKPCVVIYDTITDKTTVIAVQSRWYAKAMAAMEILEAAATPIPTLEKKTVLHAPKSSRVIRPGMQ